MPRVDTTDTNDMTASTIMTTSTTRKSKSRPPAIIDLDDFAVDDPTKAPALSPASQTAAAAAEAAALTKGNSDHLETKRQIEEMRKQFGDKWLQNHGAAQGGQSTAAVEILNDDLLVGLAVATSTPLSSPNDLNLSNSKVYSFS